jgi:hypothetical protein
MAHEAATATKARSLAILIGLVLQSEKSHCSGPFAVPMPSAPELLLPQQ